MFYSFALMSWMIATLIFGWKCCNQINERRWIFILSWAIY